MKIIISPAKKMEPREDSMFLGKSPEFMREARQLCSQIQSLNYPQVKELWKCNDKLAELNYRRFQEMNLEANLTPAILSYEGLQYQHMSPGVFSDSAWCYIKEHLRILSGLYGILGPCDGVVPYRLEMQAALRISGNNRETKNLYQFWGDKLYQSLTRNEDCIVNLASKEYSKAIEPYLSKKIRYITCVFGEVQKDAEGKSTLKVKGTRAKALRGEMVRYMAEEQINDIEGLKVFSCMGYTYQEALSEKDTLVFANTK